MRGRAISEYFVSYLPISVTLTPPISATLENRSSRRCRRNGDARRHQAVKHTGLWLSSARGSRFNQSERRSSSVWWPITAKEHGPLSNTAPLTVFHLYQSFTARGQSFVHQTLAREDVLSNAGSHYKHRVQEEQSAQRLCWQRWPTWGGIDPGVLEVTAPESCYH